MKMTFSFKVEGFELSNTGSGIVESASNISLDKFDYNVEFESKPGEMKEYMQELSKILPDLMEGIMSTIQNNQKFPDLTPTSDPAPASDQEAATDENNEM